VRWRARNRALALALDALIALGLFAGLGFVLQQRTFVRAVRAKHAEVRVAAYAAGLSAADLGLRAHEAGETRRRLAACDPELRGWEWRHLALRADSSERVLARHASAVSAVAVSPDGSTAAIGTDDGALLLADAASGAVRVNLAGHGGVVTAVVFTPDGRRLVSASRDKTVRVWDAASGALERMLAEHEADVLALALAPDGRTLASGDVRGTLVLAELASGARLARTESPGRDGLVDVDFLAEGELAAAYISGLVRVHGPDLAVRREVRASARTPTALDADPAGCTLAVAFDRTALVLDAATLASVRTLGGHASPIGALAFAPDGATLATGGYDSLVRVWELARGRLVGELAGHERDVNAIAFVPHGRQLVTGAEDDSVRLWDLAREPVAVLEAANWVSALAFSADGTTLATGGYDRVLRRYDAHTGRLRSRYESGANKWHVAGPASVRAHRTSAAVVDGLIYVIAGEGDDAELSRVSRFDPATGVWTHSD
jgi:WD40 repeat protein